MKIEEDVFPDVLRIETAGKCNFKCVHCPTGTEPNNRNHLSKEQFDSIITQLLDNKFLPRVVVLYHGGEPLLNENIVYFIRTLKKLGVKKTVITTNASLLDEELSKELILAGLDEIKTSFDGRSPSENNEIRKNSNFYKNAENVKILCSVKKSLGRNNPSIIISNVQICDKETLHELFKNNEFVLKNIPDYLIKYFANELSEVEFQSFPAMVWPGFEKFGNFTVESRIIPKPKYCPQLFETFSILSNGDVVLCCYDLKGDLILGNIYEKTMFEIWNSEKFIKIRGEFRKNSYTKFCENCNVVSPRYLCKV